MSNIRSLSKELQQKAIEELNEDVLRIPQDIQAIKDWLNQQKYIKARTDDQTIVTFLRGCKFSLERTKEKLESFYTLRTLLPEFFKNRDPFRPEIQELLNSGIFLPLLTEKDVTSPRNILVNLSGFDPAKTNKDDFLKIEIMLMDILMQEDDQVNICGINLLFQFEGLKMAHIMPPALMKKILAYTEDAIPCRTKGMLMLNMPSIFEAAYTWFRYFVKEKLRSRIHLCNNNFEDLYKICPKEQLPKEYGGEGPSLQELTEFWKKKVETYAEWFKDDEQYCTDEKVRPDHPKTSTELFGVEGADGSFRKLNVD